MALLSPQLHIDLDAIASNYRALNKLSNGKAAAVVKANAYGLGVANIARVLQNAGAKQFFVATQAEAKELKSILPDAEIFELSGQSIFEPAIENIIPVVNSPHQLQAISERPFALQFDTGMTRLGLDIEDLDAVKHLQPKLVMSHLACADEPSDELNEFQLSNFQTIASAFPKAPKSLAATGGILLGSDYQFDLTRPGIGLYGGAPFMEAKPIVQISLPVIQTRRIKAGAKIGYGGTYAARRDLTVATLLGGYADGIFRALSNQADLFHENQKCPILGRVSMDAITADVTHLDPIPDKLNLISPTQSINDLAQMANTISYELLTGLGQRFERLTYP